MIKQCKKCDSSKLYLEPRIKGQDVLTADMVALKCEDCGAWLKWCPKDERKFYLNKIKNYNAYVIMNSKGQIYYECEDSYYSGFFNDYSNITIFNSIEEAKRFISIENLKDCKPVNFVYYLGDFNENPQQN